MHKAVKTTGAELVRSFNDKSIWPASIWCEGERFKVNGKPLNGKPEFLPDDAVVSILGGAILYNGPMETHPWKRTMLPTLKEYFMTWQEKQKENGLGE